VMCACVCVEQNALHCSSLAVKCDLLLLFRNGQEPHELGVLTARALYVDLTLLVRPAHKPKTLN
jgi:hypothetical protein